MSYPLVQLGELGELFQGLAIQSTLEPGLNSFRVINIRDLNQLEVHGQGLEFGQVDLTKVKPKHHLQTGDVLLTTRTRPLRAGVVQKSLLPALAGQNLGVLRLHQNIAPLYIAGLLSSGYGQDLTNVVFNISSVVPLISLTNLKSLPIPLPPLAEQKRLAELMLQFETYQNLSQQILASKRNLLDNVLRNLATDNT